MPALFRRKSQTSGETSTEEAPPVEIERTDDPDSEGGSGGVPGDTFQKRSVGCSSILLVVLLTVMAVTIRVVL